MTIPNPRPHSVPALPLDLRLSALGRRVSASESLAMAIADLVYGTRERDHAEVLHLTTRTRITSYAEVR